MARKRCFEVATIKFTFYCSKNESEKTTLVVEAMEKCLRKYASSTRCNVYHGRCDVETPDVLVNVEFSKNISLNTAEKILNHISSEKLNHFTYTKSSKELRVSIMG